MPLVFRVMKKDEDGLPTVEPTAKGLGVRPGIDVDLDDASITLSNGKGMSVSPSWRDISVLRIPKRLRDKVPGAAGSNNTHCFRRGTGPFQAGPFATGLVLVPDSPTHGCIAPAHPVPIDRYQDDLKATRPDWRLDES